MQPKRHAYPAHRKLSPPQSRKVVYLLASQEPIGTKPVRCSQCGASVLRAFDSQANIKLFDALPTPRGTHRLDALCDELFAEHDSSATQRYAYHRHGVFK